jgi:filamentous hemagglutinin family protein
VKNKGSLNRIYRLVWSQVTGSWVAVSESSGGRGKSSSRKLIAAAISLSAAIAQGEPQGGLVTAGVGSIAQSGATTTVTQGSANLSLSWQSFNVGKQESVNFVQPSASAIAVNRIHDNNGSQILGRISANGQVFLINPNGILFGQGAQIDVGSLIASTLDISDASLNASSRSFSGAGTGSIVNQGSLHAASGGYVALMGSTVSNQGGIEAPQGFVGLGGGSAVTLSFQGSRMVGIQVEQSAINALADNGGLIRAGGGQVVMNAGTKDTLLASVVNNSGTIEAQTVENHEGRIVLLGGMAAGTVKLSGTLDASAPDGGNGGFIETSAAQVQIADGSRITTAAAAGATGVTGTWLIDPTDFTIGAGSAARSDSGMGAATLASALALSDVSISTSATHTGSELGDINVNAAVSWSANKLTLTAHHDVNINAVMSASNTASLDLQPAGHVNVGFSPDGSFAGRVDFLQANGTSARTGTGFLKMGQNDYTVIGSAAQLQAMAAGTYYALGANITATAPFTAVAGFTTAFDGLGHTIANLAISGGANTGLFATATNASIQNIGLLGGSVSGAAGTGALVGNLNGSTVRNSFSTASVTGAAGTGGLVGSMEGAGSAISNSHATGNVGQTAGGAGTGGLVGSAAGAGNISNSFATGHVTSKGAASGGLVGSTAAFGSIDNSYAMGRVQGDGAGTGGLVGSSAASGTISNSYAMGSVESVGAGTGGLVGSNTSGAIYRSFALGNVNGGGAGTGGLVGSNTSGTISESFAAGTVSGSAHSIAAPAPTAATVGASTGGLVGSNSGTIVNTYAAGNVTGYAAGIGGLVGDNFGSISKSYAAGTVAGGAGGTGIGGLVGFGTGTVTDTNSYRITGNAPTALTQASTDVRSTDLANFTTSAATHVGGNPDWDFNSVWVMPSSTASYVYPIFKGLVKEITVTAGSSSKAYDGQAYNAANNHSTSSSPLNSAFISLGYKPVSTWINAGTYSITPELTVTNSYLAPYFTVNAVAGTLTVAPKAVSVAGLSAASRDYNGNVVADLSGGTVTGLVGSETLALSGQFDSKNVGTSKAVAISTGNGSNGGLASNYSLTAPTAVTADITAKAITVAGLSAASRDYNGNVVADLSDGTVTGLVGSETLALSGKFDSKNVGTAKAVTVATADGNSGGLASNYSLTAPTAVTANITAKAITVAGLSAASRDYNGNAVAALSGGTVSGMVGSETLAFTGQFSNKNVGTAKAVTVATADGNSGGLASNYSLTAPTAVTTNITAKAITVAGLSAASRDYNGNADASLSGGTVSGMVGSETLTLSGQFDSKNVGAAKAVTVATADGSNGGLASNYSFTAPTAVTADITAKAITVAGLSAASRDYNGNADASLSGGTVTGLVGSETLTLSGQFDSKNVGTAKAVTVATGDGSNGGLASNYSLTAPTTVTASISAKALSASATALTKSYDGSTTANATLSLSGLVVGETLGSSNTASFNNQNVVGASQVTVNSATLIDGTGSASNYSLAAGQVANASISAKTISVAGLSAASRDYNGNAVAALSGGTVTGMVGSETLTLSGQFDNQNVGIGKAVSVSTGNGSNGGMASNYSLSAPSSPLSADIRAVSEVVTPVTPDTSTDTSLTNTSTMASITSSTISLARTTTTTPNAVFDASLTGTVKGKMLEIIDGGVNMP